MISQVKGSAFIEQGRTEVMVGVSWLGEVLNTSTGVLIAELKFAPFACTTKRGSRLTGRIRSWGWWWGRPSPALCACIDPRSY